MILLVALTYGFMFGVIQSYNKMQYSDNRGLRHAGELVYFLEQILFLSVWRDTEVSFEGRISGLPEQPC